MESFTTFKDAAIMASKVVAGYSKTYPGAIKESISIFMESSLKKGLELRTTINANKSPF